MSEKRIAVKVENLTKGFRIPLEASSGLKQSIINRIKGRKGYRDFQPLKNISFEVEEGDFFGIVGRNGSGKSTLLKTLAGIYTPEKGGVTVNGKLVPFIELGVGFNPELSGRENVFLNGALLGFSHAEMEAMYDEIVDFAELGDFMEERLKNYSSGMQVRLAFSIAIKAEGDILLLDEVLAVGDEAFQRKCFNYFAQLKREKKTVILVTHSMEAVQQFCNKAALIDKGYKLTIGTPLEISQIYRELNMPTKKVKSTSPVEDGEIKIGVNLKINEAKLNFSIDVFSKIDIEDASVAFILNRDSGEMVYRWVLDEHISHEIKLTKNESKRIFLSVQNIFPDGTYTVRVAVRKRDKSIDYAVVGSALEFEVVASKGNNANFWKPIEEFTEE